MICLNEKQQQGLDLALERYRQKQLYTIISGYAGTGKSTLVRFIIEELKSEFGIKEEEVVFTSFTGKATQVLQKKGNKNVSTLHRLLYKFYPRRDGTFIRTSVTSLNPYKIVVVDECSMVPKELVKELLKHRVYTIFLGDPGQLPPVDKDADNHLLDNPHIFLSEIQRQAAESEIIQLTMKIREEQPIPYMKGTEVQVIQKSELNTGMLQWADQILCATNNTRISINNQMRELLGRGENPEDGDKVICLRNYWEIASEDEAALINGAIGTLENSFSTFKKIPAFISARGGPKQVDLIQANFVTDTGEVYNSLNMDKKLILTGEKTLDWKTSYRLANSDNYKHIVPLEFTYGYAITAHKSQGSEWDNVLVIEEKFPFDKEEHKRWLYTACTRAAKKLVLVRA